MKSTFTILLRRQVATLCLPLKMPFYTLSFFFLLLHSQLVAQNCACISRVNVPLDRNCQFTLTPNLVTEGNCSGLKVTVDDRNPANGGIIDCPGLFRYIVRDASNKLVCSGEVLAEDKGGVRIDGAEFFEGALLCSDVNFVLNNPKTVGALNSATSRSPLYSGPVIDSDVKNLGIVNFSDNCKSCGCNVSVTFSDRVEYADCGELKSSGIFARIYRTWVATDCYGAKKDTVQVIKFRRPALGEFVFNNAVVDPIYDAMVTVPGCSASASGLTREQQWPYVVNYWGKKVYLDEIECQYGKTTEDLSFPTCNGKGAKIDRKILVMDWCTGLTVEAYRLLIQVGDFVKPTLNKPAKPVVVSTRAFDCTGSFPVTADGLRSLGITLSDNCSSVSFSVRIRSKGRWVSGILVDPYTWYEHNYVLTNGFVTGLNLGQHQAIFTIYDACGNNTEATIDFTVEDRTVPVMVCDDQLNVTLSNGIGFDGYARVDAKDIDEGTWDNCGLKSLKVRRSVAPSCESGLINQGYDLNGDFKLDQEDGFTVVNGKKYTPLADFAEFFCCDAGAPVEVQLWAEDFAGNRNYCWQLIAIEDKLAPTCQAPANQTIWCDDKNLGVLDNRRLSALAYGDVRVLSGNDCTPLDTAYSVVRRLNNCGEGTIERVWTLTKKGAKGNQTTTCRQILTLRAIHEYDICFPQDVVTNCKTIPADTLLVDELGCDILAVNVADVRFEGADDECYKIFRTYTVINWCAFDEAKCGTNGVYTVDRKWSNFGAAPVCVLVRDPQRNGNERFWFSRDRTPGSMNLSDGKVDTNNDENFTPPFCQAAGEYYHTFKYTQHIVVKDEVRPVVQVPTLAPFCTDAATCNGAVRIGFRASDECSDVLELETAQILVAPNRTTVLQNLVAPSVFDPRWTAAAVTKDSFAVSIANLPEGRHDLLVVVRDECGNLSTSTRIPFEVKDCKAPVPICLNSLSVNLMTDGKGGAAMAVWAKDFIASPVFDCNGQGPETQGRLKRITQYSINRLGETPVDSATSLMVTCNDAGKTIPVEIHAWDEAGNHDFCTASLTITDNRKFCVPGGNNFIAIKGVVGTEVNTYLENVEVELAGAASMKYMTDQQGGFNFANLNPGEHYKVTARKAGDVQNGVTTFDLIIVQKHVLGTQLLDSPYKMIAADVNGSKAITTLDIILMRKVILGIDQQFPTNQTWRFIPYQYKFLDPTNPWLEEIPEAVDYANLSTDSLVWNASFMAVKLGDINCSANVSSLGGPARARSQRQPWPLVLPELSLAAGEEQTLTVAAELQDLQGFQLALAPQAGLEILAVEPVVGSAEHFRLLPGGAGLLVSWNQRSPSNLAGSQPLFRLRVRAQAPVSLRAALGLQPRWLESEAYGANDGLLQPTLVFAPAPVTVVPTTPTLLGISPNPFAGETLIQFTLTAEPGAQLRLFDAMGRLVRVLQPSPLAGYQELRLKASELPGPGMYVLTLTQGGHTATQKVVVIE